MSSLLGRIARQVEISVRELGRLLVKPLFVAYRFGPRAIGLWEGQSDPEVCASLTNVPAYHWQENPDVCLQRIDDHFWSWMVFGFAILYASACVYGLCVALRAVAQWLLALISVQQNAGHRRQVQHVASERLCRVEDRRDLCARADLESIGWRKLTSAHRRRRPRSRSLLGAKRPSRSVSPDPV